MNRLERECRTARRHLARIEELDGVSRAHLDLHLRRCPSCAEVAQRFAAMEGTDEQPGELSDEQRHEIYRRLIPAIHDIAVPPRPERTIWRPRPLIVGSLAATAILLVLTLWRTGTETAGPVTAGQGDALRVATSSIALEGLVEQCQGPVQVDGARGEELDRFTLEQGTVVQLPAGSRFRFRLGDEIRVALFGPTVWQMATANTQALGFELVEGRVAVSFANAKGQVLEVGTPDATVQVVGTVFTVEVPPASASSRAGATRVGVLEGAVQVRSRQGLAQSIEVTEGQLWEQSAGSEPTATVGQAQLELAAEVRTLEPLPIELTRMVRFDGSPEQVMVEVEGRVIGTTPLSARLPQAPLNFRLTAPGMEPQAGEISGWTGRQEVAFSLRPAEEYRPVAADRQLARSLGPKARGRGAKETTVKAADWDLFQRARAAMTAGDNRYAIGLLERAITEAEGNQLVNGLARLAECYAASGQYTEAADRFGRITELVPHAVASQNARYEVGRLAMDKLGDLPRARAAFTAYLASPLDGPLREEAYYSLCELDSREGAHRDALHCFNEFLRAFPRGNHEPEARLWRGAIYQDVERRWADAERDLLAFVQAKPHHPRTDEARYRVALGRFQVKDKRGTLRMIEEYLRQHPEGHYRLRVERLRKAILNHPDPWKPESK